MAPSLPRRQARRWCRPRTVALQKQIRELHRLLGKKALEAGILREALQHADPKKDCCARATAAARRFPVKVGARTLGVARSSLTPKPAPARRRDRRPTPEDELLAQIAAIIAALPTYGYRRVHALLRRQAEEEGRPPSNHKWVWRIMKAHGLLLARHAGGAERRHDGHVAVPERNTRWCSDGFEITCDNGERVRVAFALDCCDREAMNFISATGGISGDDVRNLMVAAVEQRFGRVNRLPRPIGWLSDNGSPCGDPCEMVCWLSLSLVRLGECGDGGGVDGSAADQAGEPGGGAVADSNRRLDRIVGLIDRASMERLLAPLRAPTGRHGYPPLALFRALLLAQWYQFSNPGLEEALADRLSFRRFCGFGLDDDTPDETTLCRFRGALAEGGLAEAPFAEPNCQSDAKGLA